MTSVSSTPIPRSTNGNTKVSMFIGAPNAAQTPKADTIESHTERTDATDWIALIDFWPQLSAVVRNTKKSFKEKVSNESKHYSTHKCKDPSRLLCDLLSMTTTSAMINGASMNTTRSSSSSRDVKPNLGQGIGKFGQRINLHSSCAK